MKLMLKLFTTVLAVLAIDGATKLWALNNLSPRFPEPVIGDYFRLVLGYNTGVAFGMFSNGGNWPLIITGVIIVILIVWFSHSLYTGHFPSQAVWPIGFILGGAIGNFIDRLIDGRVVDFLDFGLGAMRWPTFNMADSFILIGVGWLMLISFTHNPAPQDEPLSTEPEPETLLNETKSV